LDADQGLRLRGREAGEVPFRAAGLGDAVCLMMRAPPQMVIIGGPNGAGKTTIARRVVLEAVGIVEYVNADVIAAGLAGFAPERAAFAAGRIMLDRLNELAEQRADFAFETTLASRTFGPWAAKLMTGGYSVHVVYVWLRTPELAMDRVRARVRLGGHSIEPDVIRRRYGRSLKNLFDLYIPLGIRSGTWRIFDNSDHRPVPVAEQISPGPPIIHLPDVYDAIREAADAERETDNHDAPDDPGRSPAR